MVASIEGVTFTSLKIIEGPLGNVMHGIKQIEPSFAGFGEAYFSTAKKGAIKGWKKHKQMTLNVIVVQGAIRFVVFDDREGSPTKNKYQELVLSPSNNYGRLTVAPGLWMAFEGLDSAVNMLMNFANILHDPNEAENSPVTENKIPYPIFQEQA
jgi:dTDP-4-dehydrorhamnose 3,5-epimerase